MYFKALKKLRDNNKLVEDTVSIFKTEKRSVFTPPADMEVSRNKVPANTKRTSRVHGITAGSNSSSGENLMFPDEVSFPEWDLPTDSVPDDEAETNQGHHDEVLADVGSEISEDSLDPENQRIESTEPERDDSWLAAVQYSPNGRQVCAFDLQTKGSVSEWRRLAPASTRMTLRMLSVSKQLGSLDLKALRT